MATETISKLEDRARLFGSHQLNEDGVTAVAVTRHAFNVLLDKLEDTVSIHNREFSLVRTKLEEALMYTVKTIALDPRYQL